MNKAEKLCVCGEYYTPKSRRDKVCSECRRIADFADCGIYQLERIRTDYNKRNEKNLTYGKFVQLIETVNLKRRAKK